MAYRSIQMDFTQEVNGILKWDHEAWLDVEVHAPAQDVQNMLADEAVTWPGYFCSEDGEFFAQRMSDGQVLWYEWWDEDEVADPAAHG